MSDPQPVLRASDIALKPGAERFSETIMRKEILGLAGLDGHGQADFLEVLAGVTAPSSGSVEALLGNRNTQITSLDDAAGARIGYMPSDRKKNGIFPNLSVEDNFTLGNLDSFSRSNWLDKRKARKALEAFRKELSISYANRNSPISSLSGGNQQKVLLARAMARNPEIMLLNDPTRGVDIQTRQSLYKYFRRSVAEHGMTLVVLSTELDEILDLCDRVVVFRDFSVSARLSKAEMSMNSLMAAMFGQKTEAVA